MFTGLVDRVGRMVGLEPRGEGARLTIAHEPWTDALILGESVSVEGVCLTVAALRAGQFQCDVLQETLRRTSLGGKAPGCRLNLERAMRADGRFGGHLVSGHVDGTGVVSRLESVGKDWLLEIAVEAELAAGMVMKGSLAIDGISLTITALTDRHVQVQLIPFSWAHTSISDARVGDRVNLETDMIGKYVARFLGAHSVAPTGSGLQVDDLQRAGFV